MSARSKSRGTSFHSVALGTGSVCISGNGSCVLEREDQMGKGKAAHRRKRREKNE